MKPLKRNLAGLLHRLGVNRLLLRSDPRPIILGFHRVIEAQDGLINRRIEHLSPGELEAVVDYLRSLGYTFVRLDEILAGDQPHAAAVTFDDGYRDVYEMGFPILKKLGVPFTIFLTTATLDALELLWQHRLYYALDRLSMQDRAAVLGGRTAETWSENRSLDDWIHGRKPADLVELSLAAAQAAGFTRKDEAIQAQQLYLTSRQIAEMATAGLTVEAHGHEHWSLPTLDPDQTRAEVAACTQIVRAVSSRPPEVYAPAFGKTNPYLQAVAKDYGIQAVVGTDEGLAERGLDLQRRIMTTSVGGLSAQLTKAAAGRWIGHG